VDFQTLELSVEESGIGTLTLDRPNALNAISPLMEREFLEAFDCVDADDRIRALVVTGRGRAFCAGADLSEGDAGFDVIRRALERGTEALGAEGIPRDGGGMMALRVFACKKPVIAAINGPAVGAGATVPLAMDVRLSSERAKFGMVFARRGMCPDAASSWFLPRIVGISRALDWMIGAPDGGAPARIAGDSQSRGSCRRRGRRGCIPPEATGAVPAYRVPGHARRLPVGARAYILSLCGQPPGPPPNGSPSSSARSR